MIDYFFFFQAEDGIRDKLVTGVQTCALPICPGGLENYLNKVREHGRMAEAGKAVVFVTPLPADDPEAMEAKYGEHLAYIPNWYRPGGGPVANTRWSGETEPSATSWFVEPSVLAKQ